MNTNEQKAEFPKYVWFHSTWGTPIPDGGKIVKVLGYYRKSEKHDLNYEDEKGNTMTVTDCIDLKQINSYEPMQQRIKELEEALEDIASENYDDDCDADDLFNIIDRCKQTAREVLQSSKQL